MKSYGRTPTFLMITGYEQVRSDIGGDRAAAVRVEPVLPETGVCNTGALRPAAAVRRRVERTRAVLPMLRRKSP